MVSQLTIFTSISFYSAVCFSSKTATHNHDSETERNSKAQFFESRLALNPGLNLNRVSLSYVQKHFLG